MFSGLKSLRHFLIVGKLSLSFEDCDRNFFFFVYFEKEIEKRFLTFKNPFIVS